MRRTVFVVVSLFAWSAASAADLPSAPPKAQAKTPASVDLEDAPVFVSPQASGRILQWSPDSGELLLQTSSEDLPLVVQDSATVFVNGRLGEREEIQKGQSVRAAYEHKGDERRVRWLEVLPEQKDEPTPGRTAPKKTASPKRPAP